jgi:alpha-beta hydrolase superfamily lysophospholipase
MPFSAVWFGEGRPDLFGWVGKAASVTSAPGVVLCPPLGRDAANSHYTYRLLAEQLIDAGLIAVRFDYAGTGDSVGDGLGDHLVQEWLASIEAAVAFARGAGATSVSLVGLRVGALLVEHAAERMGDLRSLVLWDPSISGRAFVRGQRALELLREGAIGGPVKHSGIPWLDMSSEGLEDLMGLAAPEETQRRPIPTLLLHRPDDSNVSRVLTRLAAQPVEQQVVTGQYELLDLDPVRNEVPRQTITLLVDWFRATLSEEVSPLPTPGSPDTVRTVVTSDHAIVEADASQGPITESIIQIGTARLFGIETVAGQPDPSLPKIVFLNSGRVSHVSPGRLWVRMARALAGLGFHCLRFDLSSLGDSPTRPGQADQTAAGIEAFEDIEAAARAISPENPSNIVLIGLSSGGYHALELGLRLTPRAICVINPVIAFNPAELEHGRLDPRRRVAIPKSQLEASAARHITSPRIHRLLSRVAWLTRQLRYRDRMQSVWLRELVESNVTVYGICAPLEAVQLLGEPRLTLPKLAPTGRLEVDVINGLDHALIPQDHQQIVEERLTKFLVDRFLTPSAQGEEPVPAGTLNDVPEE